MTSQQYKNAVGYFCWMDACIEAVVSTPNLRRLSIDVPRVIPSGSLSIPPEIITLPNFANLCSKLTAHGKTLQEFRITASMASEKAETDREAAILRFLAPGPPSLTFIVTPAEKDWDAAQGTYNTSCPELEHAEDLLRRGYLSRLSETGEYSTARRTADDISTYVYKGTIAPKKKIRPMPVWLTPEEEQDRREGPPSQSRRMKRALIRSVSDFAGVWRLPMTETSPRTAAEKALSRREAALVLGALIPDLTGSVVGRANAQAAGRKLGALLNNRRLNAHLVLTLLDTLVGTVFPEMMTNTPA